MLSEHIRQTAYIFVTDHFGNLRYRKHCISKEIFSVCNTTCNNILLNTHMIYILEYIF